jgi:hypothetical protein
MSWRPEDENLILCRHGYVQRPEAGLSQNTEREPTNNLSGEKEGIMMNFFKSTSEDAG